MIKLQGKSQIITKDESVDVFRDGCVTYVDGKPAKGEPEKFKVKGNFQPLSGRDLMMVPEGDRFKEQIWLYTADLMKINDRVVRCGVNYQAQTVNAWGSYSQVRLMRIDVGQNATP